MTVKITKRWKRFPYSTTSMATIKGGELWCHNISWQCNRVNSWQGEAKIWNFRRQGPVRRSETKARKDAEQLSTDLLLDIEASTKILMQQCGISED